MTGFLRCFLRCYRTEPANPVIVYHMGKVASSSIALTLKATKAVDVFQVHRLNPKNIEQVRRAYIRRRVAPPGIDSDGLYLYKKIIKPKKKPVKIISLIREPIGRNISAFFQAIDFFEGKDDAYKDLDTKQLIEDFLQGYSHNVPLTWFDIEMRVTTGIDVYQYSFPYHKGYCIIEAPPYNLMIMRHDLDDRQKEKCLAEFIGIESVRLLRANEASLKAYSNEYQAFIDSIKVPDEYAER